MAAATRIAKAVALVVLAAAALFLLGWSYANQLTLLKVLGSAPAPPPPRTRRPPCPPSTPRSLCNPSCGFESCHPVKEGMLNVHLVPHTHNDVGWLKTADDYYHEDVRQIIDSVIDSLADDANRRFIYVETAFLWKWWQEQSESRRDQLKRLVNEGRLELVGGGWSMNDEAVTHYQSTIDQMTWGMRRLNDSFGPCGRPRAGWQIDPFGHSRETAAIFAQLGFDGLFFGRLDYQDKEQRLVSKTTEMVWQASVNLGKRAELFTSLLHNHYGPPPDFCFDVLCHDETIRDDTESHTYNVDQKVKDFINLVHHQNFSYTSNNILMTMGDDFHYRDAATWFTNLDKLICYVNAEQASGSKINVLYSTPSCYLKAVNDKNLTWTKKFDDFFPYGSDAHSYWTGYFSSRPTLKYFERLGNNALQICKQLYAITDLGPEDLMHLNTLREAMGVMQHHDAITGTEKEHVAQDYARMFTDGLEECNIIAQKALNKMLVKKDEADLNQIPTWEFCLRLNISECPPSEKYERFVVTVYNPLARPLSIYIRFPVGGSSYIVENPDGKAITAQIVPLPAPLLKMPGRASSAKQDLVFRAENLPPLGVRSYFISKVPREEASSVLSTEEKKYTKIGFKDHYHTISSRTGTLKTMYTHGVKFNVKTEVVYYRGKSGDNRSAESRSSGAYVFRPNNTNATPLPYPRAIKKITGPLLEEIHVEYTKWVSQVIRTYADEDHTEIDWQVGPIPVEDKIGKEVVVRYKSSLASGGVFYTDSNGRELLSRRRNHRSTWKVDLDEPVAGNYYPVTTRLLLRDPERRMELAVLTDRAQGGSSLADGELELMVHRRLLHDDGFGLEEALNEEAFGYGLVARGRHYLVGGPYTGSQGMSLAASERLLVQQKLLQPWIFFSRAEKDTPRSWAERFHMEVSGLRTALPPNVHLLTLEPWKKHSLLLRLEHIMEKGEDLTLSQPATVSLKDLFAPFSIKSVRETTLGANQWLMDAHRLEWLSESNSVNQFPNEAPMIRNATATDDGDDAAEEILKVTLTPMQIRTFVIEVKFDEGHQNSSEHFSREMENLLLSVPAADPTKGS